ncbi:MAG: SIS domain-containing protein [Rhodobacteraceae bacterium]|nr:SIS domain-containing protein [Paracoccaceae bacterium]
MALDIAEIPEVARHQISEGLDFYFEEGTRIAELAPPVIVTCARGTSHCAATYFKYLVETGLGLPVASIGPSISSVYGARMRLPGSVCITVSQSGASPDLVAMQACAIAGGAKSLAVVNQTESPVARDAERAIPILAGPERAVAATKTFIASLIALCGLYAGMSGSRELAESLQQLPDALAKTWDSDWSSAFDQFAGVGHLFVISRGVGLAIAQEAALKLKEMCGVHAEGISSAEILHGPVALADDGMPVLAFVPDDAGQRAVLESVQILEQGGASVICVGNGLERSPFLPVPQSSHPAFTPICQIACFYGFAEALAGRLGANPDTHHRLSKVTRTI